MKRVKSIIFLCILFCTFSAFSLDIPSPQTTEGFIAYLLINEVPFPGEKAYRNKNDSKDAMMTILTVLDNRLRHIPSGYTQKEIAAIRAKQIIDVITAGGIRGQVDGFYRDKKGTLAIHSRVKERVDYLVQIASKGKPGTFADVLNHAVSLARNYISSPNIVTDPFASLTFIKPYHVTSRGYSWMTDAGNYHPGGDFIYIPDVYNGIQGGNRFFTLRKR